jgi:hypothetical protein
MAKRRTKQEIEDLLRRYDERGSVTRRAFCESQRIPLATLAYYLQRERAKPIRLARIKLSNGAGVESRFALVLTSGRRIECGLAELPHLISAAERA